MRRQARYPHAIIRIRHLDDHWRPCLPLTWPDQPDTSLPRLWPIPGPPPRTHVPDAAARRRPTPSWRAGVAWLARRARQVPKSSSSARGAAGRHRVEGHLRVQAVELVAVATRFGRFCGKFVCHCHKLEHENMGMTCHSASYRRCCTTSRCATTWARATCSGEPRGRRPCTNCGSRSESCRAGLFTVASATGAPS